MLGETPKGVNKDAWERGPLFGVEYVGDLPVPPEPPGTYMPLATSVQAVRDQPTRIVTALNSEPNREAIDQITEEVIDDKYSSAVVLGSGDSLWVARLAAAALNNIAGVPAVAINALDYEGVPHSLEGGRVLGIAISSSGRAGDAHLQLARLREELTANSRLTGILLITDASEGPYTEINEDNEVVFRPGARSGVSEIPTRTTTAAGALTLDLAVTIAASRGLIQQYTHDFLRYEILRSRFLLEDLLRFAERDAYAALQYIEPDKYVTCVGGGLDYMSAALFDQVVTEAAQVPTATRKLGDMDHALRTAAIPIGSTVVTFATQGISARHAGLAKTYDDWGINWILMGTFMGDEVAREALYGDKRVVWVPSFTKPFGNFFAAFSSHWVGIGVGARRVNEKEYPRTTRIDSASEAELIAHQALAQKPFYAEA